MNNKLTKFMSKKAPTFSEELNYEKCISEWYNVISIR